MSAVRLDTGLELLLERSASLAGAPVLATLVATAGSTYRKPGARLLVDADGRIEGLISGGCLETDLVEHAARVRADGACRVVEYDLRDEDDVLYGIGAGCEGAMRILLEPAGPGTPAAAALAHAAEVTRAGRATALGIVHEGPPAALGTRGWPDAADADPALRDACARALDLGTSTSLRWNDETVPTEAWVQFLAPAPHVLICGAGPDAVPLARLLRGLGWSVTLVDHRPAWAAAVRVAGATVHCEPAEALAARLAARRHDAAVVMSHHLHADAAYLRALAAHGPAYVGLLGPRPRRERLLGLLGPAADALGARLRGPVGLDLGAATPEAIALAIAAELHAVAAGRSGGPCSRAGEVAAGSVGSVA